MIRPVLAEAARPMRRLTAVATAVLLSLPLLLAAGPAAAQQSSPEAAQGPFDADEQQEIRRLVREYLLENPEVIMEAVEVLRERQQAATEQDRQDALAANAAALRDPGILEVFGNPDGDVTIVEFFDYRCPYCRSVTEPLLEVVRADGNVRLVMKEYPILGQASTFAARAAAAAALQGKYKEFHLALMTELQEVTQAGVLKLAERMELDAERLQEDMQSDQVDKLLRDTFRLAEALQIGGTPAFVVGDQFVAGAAGPERLKQLIAQARDSRQ